MKKTLTCPFCQQANLHRMTGRKKIKEGYEVQWQCAVCETISTTTMSNQRYWEDLDAYHRQALESK